MKFLKFILILLIPAMGLVSCHKSDAKPGCGNNNSQNTEETNVGARFADPDMQTKETPQIVGSGDDDRDGGDKKQKKSH